MSAKLPLLNDLQREFAGRAHREQKGYVLPWTRGFLRNPSSLDSIYEALGQADLNYQNIRDLKDRVPFKKKQKYVLTLQWLTNHILNGGYQQVGNSCGAWSLTHWEMRRDQRYYGGNEFTGLAQGNYDDVKFLMADGGVAPPPLLNVWANIPLVDGGPYSNPWKIRDKIRGSEVKVLQNARDFADNHRHADALAQCFYNMLQTIEDLQPVGAHVTTVANGALDALPTGGRAIIFAYRPPLIPVPALGINVVALHYMLLVRTAAGWELYNSNSHKLNPKVLHASPQFRNPIVTDLKNTNGNPGGNETWRFLGVFIT